MKPVWIVLLCLLGAAVLLLLELLRLKILLQRLPDMLYHLR